MKYKSLFRLLFRSKRRVTENREFSIFTEPDFEALKLFQHKFLWLFRVITYVPEYKLLLVLNNRCDSTCVFNWHRLLFHIFCWKIDRRFPSKLKSISSSQRNCFSKAQNSVYFNYPPYGLVLMFCLSRFSVRWKTRLELHFLSCTADTEIM